jgi:hypothetical protein
LILEIEVLALTPQRTTAIVLFHLHDRYPFTHEIDKRFYHNHIDLLILFVPPNLLQTFVGHFTVVTDQVVVLALLLLLLLVVPVVFQGINLRIWLVRR